MYNSCVSSFAFNLISASIVLPTILFLFIVMMRFPHVQYPPLFAFGSLSFLYLALEAAIEYLALSGGSFSAGVQLHRISEIVAAGTIAPLMFLLDRLFRLPPVLRRVTRFMMWCSIGVTVSLTGVAFIAPDLFVSVSVPLHGFDAAGTPIGARGAYGPVYDLRNLYLAIYAPYTLAAMIIAGFRRARLQRVWLITIGTAVIIFTGLDDVLGAFTGSNLYLDGIEFSRFSIGIAVFMVSALVALMSRFAQYAREVSDAADTLHAHQERLRDLATIDQLTGVENRDVLMTELMQSTHRSLMLIDIDFFRTVNEAYGRTRADAVLVEVTTRLKEIAGTEGAVYRIGPDRFALLVSADETATELAIRAEKVVNRLRVPVEAYSLSIYLTASVGAVAAGPGDGADEVMNNAESALDEAKADRNCARVVSPRLQTVVQRRDAIVNRLSLAIQSNALELVYQPIFDQEMSAVSMEALVRWSDDELGVVGPREFIPIAEDCGLIVPLTEFVVSRTLADLNTLPPGRNVTVNVNISQHELRSRQFVRYLIGALERSNAGPSSITLEIAEDALVRELADSLGVLGELQQRGVRVLLDDFGAGLSLLASLPTLPVHGIKIDPRFLASEGESGGDDLLRNMINLGHRLGLSVAAEGVETEAQLARLAAFRVDYYQGRHLAKPAAFAETSSRLYRAS